MSTEYKFKFQPKLHKKQPFPVFWEEKNTFYSHTMNFEIKFQPLQMSSDYCHKVLSDLKFPIN